MSFSYDLTPPHSHRRRHACEHRYPSPPAAQRKGAVLRRGKPTVVPRSQANGHANALKGYSLLSDGTPRAAQSPAQNGDADRPRQTHRRPGAKQKPYSATGQDTPATAAPARRMLHAADDFQAVGPALLEPAATASAAAGQRAAEGPLDGRRSLQSGASGDATQRLAGKKRKLVGAAQQAGIVSGILAHREPAARDTSAGAQSGVSASPQVAVARPARRSCCGPSACRSCSLALSHPVDDDLGAVSGEGADDVMAAVAAMKRRDRTLEASLPAKAGNAPAQAGGQSASDSDDEARFHIMFH